MRVYPHLQDSGGFFVAVLERRVPSAGAVNAKFATVLFGGGLRLTWMYSENER